MNTAADASRQGPVKAAWILLILAWAIFFFVPYVGIIIGGPLDLVVFILAIVILANGNTKQGIVLLLCSLLISPLIYWIAPIVLLFLGMGAAHVAG